MEEFDRKKNWSNGKQGKLMFTSLPRKDQYFNINIRLNSNLFMRKLTKLIQKCVKMEEFNDKNYWQKGKQKTCCSYQKNWREKFSDKNRDVLIQHIW